MLIHKGAEANLYLEYWFGKTVIRKERIAKSYRIPQLDKHLRYSRTKNESKLLSVARNVGVPTPLVYFVDLDNFSIYMEYIEGQKIRDFIDSSDMKTIELIAEKIAQNIAKLHANNIIHADLTTSNMIFYKDTLYFVDFGLSYFSTDIEDKAVDLHMLRRAIESTHILIGNTFYQKIISYYIKYYPEKARAIVSRTEEIASRGRYIERCKQ
ncbi:MAG: KEOPS complex kinase/ATPase Bud32 [Candidatus Asgardarchaeia archaeon]